MNMKRQRGRGNGRNKPHMPVRAQTFDSSGPDVRIRGNAYQVLEKYLALARDATAAGDRIAAENFYQHAEHYFRMINASSDGHRPQMGQPQQQHAQPHQQGQHPHNAQPHDRMAAAHEGQQALAEPGSGPQPLTTPYPSTPGDGQPR